MKVLQVINSLNTGGAEKLLLEAIPLYNKEGIKMDILLLNGTEYPFLKTLRKLDCCTIYSLSKGSVYNPLLIFKIISFLKMYDIAHVHLFPAQYFVALAKLVSFSSIKLIYTEHSTSNRRIRNRTLSLLEKFIYKRYSKVVCISNNVFKIVKNHANLEDSKFIVINNGINLNQFQITDSIIKNVFFGLADYKLKIIIQVSSFQEPKDQQTLIKALKFLPETVKLILVGDGFLRKECENLVKELNLDTRVLFLGIRTDVPQLLKTADIVVLSSKYEGLSLSSIEGMASGKPFIASNVLGLKDIVNGAGLLFPVGDEIALSNHISELLEDESYYKQVAKRCLNRAKKYDINIMIEKYLKLYKKIANTK